MKNVEQIEIPTPIEKVVPHLSCVAQRGSQRLIPTVLMPHLSHTFEEVRRNPTISWSSIYALEKVVKEHDTDFTTFIAKIAERYIVDGESANRIWGSLQPGISRPTFNKILVELGFPYRRHQRATITSWRGIEPVRDFTVVNVPPSQSETENLVETNAAETITEEKVVQNDLRYAPSERLLSILTPKNRPSARQRILELFLLSPDINELHIREIARRIEGEVIETRRELSLFESLGVIKHRRPEQDRRLMLYSINTDPNSVIRWVIPLTHLLHSIRGDQIATTEMTEPILTIEERDRVVKMLRDQGLGNKQIEQQTGIPYTTILSSLSRLDKKGELRKVYARRITDINDYAEKVRECRMRGYKPNQIIEELSISKSQLTRIVGMIKRQAAQEQNPNNTPPFTL